MKQSMTLACTCLTLTTLCGCPSASPEILPDEGTKPVGLIQLIEFHDIQGLRNWAHELDVRGLRSLAFIQKNMLEEYPAEFKWLAAQGHEIGGGYAEQALWDVDYETQFTMMQETKEVAEQVTGKPMESGICPECGRFPVLRLSAHHLFPGPGVLWIQ